MCGSSYIDGMVIVLLGRMMILYNSEWTIFKITALSANPDMHQGLHGLTDHFTKISEILIKNQQKLQFLELYKTISY
jgi:hypothetical protein